MLDTNDLNIVKFRLQNNTLEIHRVQTRLSKIQKVLSFYTRKLNSTTIGQRIKEKHASFLRKNAGR